MKDTINVIDPTKDAKIIYLDNDGNVINRDFSPEPTKNRGVDL